MYHVPLRPSWLMLRKLLSRRAPGGDVYAPMKSSPGDAPCFTAALLFCICRRVSAYAYAVVDALERERERSAAVLSSAGSKKTGEVEMASAICQLSR